MAWWALFALFLGVRAYHLGQAPAANACADEYAWTWSGMSLLETGKPRGWSWLDAYSTTRRELVLWRGHRYELVEPWLDHPPLYSLYVGSWMLAAGQRDPFAVDLRAMRRGSLLLAAVSFVLFGAVLRRLVTPITALVALLFYSVMPLVVLQQRLAVSENLFVPLSLAIMWLALQRQRHPSRWRTCAIILLSALLPLVKLAALSTSVFLVLWCMLLAPSDRRIQCGGAVALGTCLGLAAYWAYGSWLDAGLFRAVLSEHRGRFDGFGGMLALLAQPRLVDEPSRELLPVIGSALAIGSAARPRVVPFGLAVLVYVACMAFFVDQRHVYGWYAIPLYPWICAALALAVVRASRERNLGLSLLWCSAAALTIASIAYDHRLLGSDSVRGAYLLALLAVYGCWFAWPRVARATMPLLNGALVAAVSLLSLYEVYTH